MAGKVFNVVGILVNPAITWRCVPCHQAPKIVITDDKSGRSELKRLVAVHYLRRTTSGKTAPFFAVAEDSAGARHEVIVKYTNQQLPEQGLVREAMAAMLGRRLGLGMPEPFAIELQRAFIDGVAAIDSGLAGALRNTCGVAFGSAQVRNSVLVGPTFQVPPAALRQAAEIMAFDCFVQNCDRGPHNPNLLWDGTKFAPLDHELAWRPPLFAAPVWQKGALTQLVRDHVFWKHLMSTVPDLSQLEASWGHLADAEIAGFVSAVPSEWTASNGVTTDLSRFISEVRDNIGAAVAEVLRALS